MDLLPDHDIKSSGYQQEIAAKSASAPQGTAAIQADNS